MAGGKSMTKKQDPKHYPKALKCRTCGELYDHVFVYGGGPPYAGHYANCEVHGPIKIPRTRFEACVNGGIPVVGSLGEMSAPPPPDPQMKITQFPKKRRRRRK